ncbi:MAG: hypothetical protein DRH03_07415 [Deltaproteobacteria bacterium]|nr:MAG: hypothetical protein DRH03_07415 [Deltaproteobacteria bacterium]
MADQPETKLYLIFQSIHNVMLAEELLLQANIKIEMVPVPRDISSDCGMSLTCPADDLEKVRISLKKAKFTTPVTIYKSVKEGRKQCFYNSSPL